MHLKTRLLIGVAAMVAFGAGAQTKTPTIEQLQAQLQAMQQMVTNLQQQINDLKTQQQHPSAQAQQQEQPPAQSVAQAMGITNQSGILFAAPTIRLVPHPTEVTSHESFTDYQEGAPRANDRTLDPAYRG